MEVEDKNTQLRENVTQIDRQQREIQTLRVGIHFMHCKKINKSDGGYEANIDVSFSCF